jgi:predicted N-acetyltransferase YhbS
VSIIASRTIPPGRAGSQGGALRAADIGTHSETDVRIRPATSADVGECGRVIYEAFRGIAEEHRFPPDFPTPEHAIQLADMFIGHPDIFGVVAQAGDEVVGCNFLDERDAIRGLGPITVAPRAQARGIGRQLMQAALDRGRDAAGVRLLQDSFNTRSLSLYGSLGFDAKEPVALMTGRPKSQPTSGVEVRPLAAGDLDACAALCRQVHGFDRRNELSDALKLFSPVVVLRGGRVTGYASTATFWPLNHGVAESEADMRALLLGASALTTAPLALLVPVRQAEFFRWCLSEGLRVIKPMTLMALGQHREPAGCWFCSVLY